MGKQIQFDREKYEKLHATMSKKYKLILYLLISKNFVLEEIVKLKFADISIKGIAGVPLPSAEQLVLAQYLMNVRKIVSLEAPLFSGRDGGVMPLCAARRSLARYCRNAGVRAEEVGIEQI